MQYITGQTINATTIEFATARGSTISIVLARNAKLNDAAQQEKAARAKIEAIISSVMP